MAQKTDFENIRRNSERLQQVATLLAPAERTDLCAKILRHIIYWWGQAEKCGNMPGRWIFQPHSLLAVKCGLRNEQQSHRGVAILRKFERIETKARKIKGTPRLHLKLSYEIEKLLAHLSSKFPDDDAPLAERQEFQRVWNEALRLDLRNSSLPDDQTLHHVMQKSLSNGSTAGLLVEVDRVLKIALHRSLKNKEKTHAVVQKMTKAKELSNSTVSNEPSLVTVSNVELGYQENPDKEKAYMVTPCVTTGPQKKKQGLGKKETSPSAPSTPQSPPAATIAGVATISADVLTKWKAEAKAQHGGNESATATPRGAFEAVWRDVYLKNYDAPFPAFTARQRGQVKHILDRAATVGLQADNVGAVRAFVGWIVGNWVQVIWAAKSAAGVYKPPSRPDVGFLLKHVGISFGEYAGQQAIKTTTTTPPKLKPMQSCVPQYEYGINPHKMTLKEYFEAKLAAREAEDMALNLPESPVQTNA